VSGDPTTVHQANVSVRGKTRPEGNGHVGHCYHIQNAYSGGFLNIPPLRLRSGRSLAQQRNRVSASQPGSAKGSMKGYP